MGTPYALFSWTLATIWAALALVSDVTVVAHQ